MGHRPRLRHDHGQAIPLVVLLLAVGALGLLIVARTGAVAGDRARAQRAADAVALAGAAEGREAAVRFAVANDALLESFEWQGDRVVVRVRVGAARATAAAERSWERCGGRDPCGRP
jgi:hypothetical protein